MRNKTRCEGLRVCQLSTAESVLIGRKVNFPASKPDTFHLEKQALLCTRLEAEFDLTSSPDNPPPRKCVRRAGVKKLRHHAVIARVPRSGSDLSVCGDATLWD
jgi:hypothetical protein